MLEIVLYDVTLVKGRMILSRFIMHGKILDDDGNVIGTF